jgi:hypothetical protein
LRFGARIVKSVVDISVALSGGTPRGPPPIFADTDCGAAHLCKLNDARSAIVIVHLTLLLYRKNVLICEG